MIPEKTSAFSPSESTSQIPPDVSGVETQSPPIYDSQVLLRGVREIVIRHNGELYRLRLTRNNKLILNK